MTPEQEFAAASQLVWQQDGPDAWILLKGRRRMGRVVRDRSRSTMWRSTKSSGLSDMANLVWSKDAVFASATRELAYEAACKPPPKTPVNRGVDLGIEAPTAI